MTNGKEEQGLTLSEFERLKLENFALKHNLMQSQLRQIEADRSVFLNQLEADHPGYRWDEQKGLVEDVVVEDVREEPYPEMTPR